MWFLNLHDVTVVVEVVVDVVVCISVFSVNAGLVLLCVAFFVVVVGVEVVVTEIKDGDWFGIYRTKKAYDLWNVNGVVKYYSNFT